MRILTIALASFIAFGLSTVSSSARDISLHKHSVDELKSVCSKVGGSFSQDSNGYACGTNCHGGPGTDCVVDCKNDQNCVAQVIGARRPSTIAGALQAPTKGAR